MLSGTFPVLILATTLLSPAIGAPPEDLPPLLAEQLKNHPDLPALCAVVIVDGAYHGGGAVGVRKRGDKTPVTLQDKFHLGSCTKSFTAPVAAALVEDGKVEWEETLGEALKSLRPHDDYQGATLRQLLTNTGGFPNDVPPDIWAEAWNARGNPVRQRKEFAQSMLALAPAYAPGAGYAYSNTGFSVAGVLMETALDTSWEDLVRKRVFVPLEMATAGFGAPATNPRKVDQPWGHDAKGSPAPPGDRADNPPAIAPAGAIHSSLPDLARYVLMHLKSDTGTVLKNKASFEQLHTAPANDYAMGWIVVERPWAKGKVLTHMGSNTMFTCLITIAPERGFATLVATNIGSDVASKPCDEVVTALIERYLDEGVLPARTGLFS